MATISIHAPPNLMHLEAARNDTPHLSRLIRQRRPSALLDTDGFGRTPLHVSAEHGHPESVRLLLARCPEAALVYDARGYLAIHCASEHGHHDCVEALLEAESAADNTADGKGQLEAEAGAAAASSLALEPKPVDAPTADATASPTPEPKPADAPTADGKARTPLHLAAACRVPACVLWMVSSAGCDPLVADAQGMLPLHVAAAAGDSDTCRLLLDRAPTAARAVDAAGRLPLHYAAAAASRAVCALLLEHCLAEIDARDGAGGATALALASGSGHVPVVRELLKRGAKHAVADRAGETALHRARRHGHAAVAALLQERGANCDAPSACGVRPCDLARRYVKKEQKPSDAGDRPRAAFAASLRAVSSTYPPPGPLVRTAVADDRGDAAEAELWAALDAAVEAQGTQSPAAIQAMSVLSHCLRIKGDAAAAANILESMIGRCAQDLGLRADAPVLRIIDVAATALGSATSTAARKATADVVVFAVDDLACVVAHKGDYDAAAALEKASIRALRKLEAAPRVVGQLHRCSRHLGAFLSTIGETDVAIRVLEQAVEMYETGPDQPSDSGELRSHLLLGRAYWLVVLKEEHISHVLDHRPQLDRATALLARVAVESTDPRVRAGAAKIVKQIDDLEYAIKWATGEAAIECAEVVRKCSARARTELHDLTVVGGAGHAGHWSLGMVGATHVV